MAFAASVTAPPAASAQRRPDASPVTDARIDRLERWLKAVDQHVPGADDEPLLEVRSWSNADLRALWIDASVVAMAMRNPKGGGYSVKPPGATAPIAIRYTALQLRRIHALACAAAGIIGEPDCVDIKAALDLDAALLALSRHATGSALHGDRNYVLRRGALLHADIVILTTPSEVEPVGNAPPSGPQRLRLEISDGREVERRQDPMHWDIARMALDHVTPPNEDRPAPSRDEMVRQWYRATAAWMQNREDHDTAHLSHALELFPTDADLLFLSACQRETYAAPTIQNAMRSADLPVGVKLAVGPEATELRAAEGFFRRALAVRPDFDEARLRLGRVLALLGRHEDAAGQLRQAMSSADDPLLHYYRDLFLGAEEEALGRFDAAHEAYQRAAALYPMAQSPLLALSKLARRRGERTAAQSALRRVFELPSTEPERDDPWWTYHAAQARNAFDLLDELRRPFVSEF